MNNYKIYWIAFLLMAFLQFNLPVFAKTNAKADTVLQAETEVVRITRKIVNDLEKNKAKYKANPALHKAMIRNQVLPFIDFEAMGKLTLGKHWRTASATQRNRFINAYREMLIRSYGNAMLKYSGAKISATNSVAKKKPGYVKVRTIVIPKGGAPIKANYDVRNKSGKWKAYNVEIAGISLITNFRTNFTREVSQKGLDALISRLEKSNH